MQKYMEYEQKQKEWEKRLRRRRRVSKIIYTVYLDQLV